MADDIEKKMLQLAAQIVTLDAEIRQTRAEMSRILDQDRMLLQIADKALTLVERWISHGCSSAMMNAADLDRMLTELQSTLKEAFPNRSAPPLQ